MLSPESVSVVRATADTVIEHGEEITGRFYDRLFDAHPELLNLFNRGNQANGTQRQALAMAVAAAGAHLAGIRQVPLRAVVERIAHKHASLGVAPAQYMVVHRHLIGAIGEVLSDAATPAVIDAWSEVFWAFACLLVAEESRLYTRAGTGFEQLMSPYRVAGVVPATEDVTSFWLEPVSGRIPAHEPGQYVSVAVDLPGIGRQIRQFTVSSPPGDERLRITVKRHRGEDGRPPGMVSGYLHDVVREGDEIQLSPPFGDLVLPAGDAPLILASAGVGITPVIASLHHLVATGDRRQITVAHADRSPSTHPLRAEMLAAADRLPGASLALWYKENPFSGRPDVRNGLIEPGLVPAGPSTQALLCGPLPFMAALRRSMLDRGVPAENIHYEVFGPDTWLGEPVASAAR